MRAVRQPEARTLTVLRRVGLAGWLAIGAAAFLGVLDWPLATVLAWIPLLPYLTLMTFGSHRDAVTPTEPPDTTDHPHAPSAIDTDP